MIDIMFKIFLNAARTEAYTMPVKVKGLEDTTVNAYGLYELKKNVETEVPRWMAYVLAKKQKAELLDEEKIGIEELARLGFLETRTAKTPSSIHKLPLDFYVKIKNRFEILREMLKNNPSPNLIEEYRNMEMFVRDIIRSRLRKILTLTLTIEEPKEIIERLTPEERTLYRLLRNIIKIWIKETSGLKY